MDRNYDVITFILTRPRAVIFADIIKIVTTSIKTIFTDPKNYVFFDAAKFAEFW